MRARKAADGCGRVCEGQLAAGTTAREGGTHNFQARSDAMLVGAAAKDWMCDTAKCMVWRSGPRTWEGTGRWGKAVATRLTHCMRQGWQMPLAVEPLPAACLGLCLVGLGDAQVRRGEWRWGLAKGAGCQVREMTKNWARSWRLRRGVLRGLGAVLARMAGVCVCNLLHQMGCRQFAEVGGGRYIPVGQDELAPCPWQVHECVSGQSGVGGGVWRPRGRRRGGQAGSLSKFPPNSHDSPIVACIMRIEGAGGQRQHATTVQKASCASGWRDCLRKEACACTMAGRLSTGLVRPQLVGAPGGRLCGGDPRAHTQPRLPSRRSNARSRGPWAGHTGRSGMSCSRWCEPSSVVWQRRQVHPGSHALSCLR